MLRLEILHQIRWNDQKIWDRYTEHRKERNNVLWLQIQNIPHLYKHIQENSGENIVYSSKQLVHYCEPNVASDSFFYVNFISYG